MKHLLLIGLIFSCGTIYTQTCIPVMIDGEINTQEWIDSEIIEIGSNYSILFKEDQRYYYLSIKRLNTENMYIDLFINQEGKHFNIHASQQIGSRELKDTTWTDDNPPLLWSYNRNPKDWMANAVKTDRKKRKKLIKDGMDPNEAYKQSVMPYDGFEFQFSKETWNFRETKFRVEVRDLYEYPKTFVIFPSNSIRKNDANWFVFIWE